MLPRSTFIEPLISTTASRQLPRFRRNLLAPKCSLADRGTEHPRVSSLSPQHEAQEVIDRHLRELRLHYNRFQASGTPDPATAKFLEDFSRLLKQYHVNVSLPTEPTLTNLSTTGEYYLWATRIISKLRITEPEETEDDLDSLRSQSGATGPTRLRNAFFLGIPLKYLRAHEAFHPLPTPANVTMDSCESFAYLRHDSEPFLAAWQTLPLRANELWPLLGFGEENSVSTLLPLTCRGHKHALRAWKKLFSSTSPGRRKRTFHERFAHEHVANATLSYIINAKKQWTRAAPNAPPWCDAVQLLETGCWVHTEDQVTLAAAPAARVIRRNEDDFWMWGSVDTILITKAESIFTTSSRFQSCFQSSKARRKLDLLSWIEAQFSMLCSGPNIRFADVVCYATLGGVSIFQVKRDDKFLQAGLETLNRFMERFVKGGCPPHAGFEKGDLLECMSERIERRFEDINGLAHLFTEDSEKELMPWRRRMNDWELERSRNPFFEDRNKLREVKQRWQ